MLRRKEFVQFWLLFLLLTAFWERKGEYWSCINQMSCYSLVLPPTHRLWLCEFALGATWAPSSAAWVCMTRNPWGHRVFISMLNVFRSISLVTCSTSHFGHGIQKLHLRSQRFLRVVSLGHLIVPGCSCHGNEQPLCRAGFLSSCREKQQSQKMCCSEMGRVCALYFTVFVYASIKSHFNLDLSLKRNSEED